MDIRSDSDRDATIDAVKKDIPFKGHNAWILIFSVFVASIGLNVSSTAIVIGAMLISPLMGSIVGGGAFCCDKRRRNTPQVVDKPWSNDGS